MTEEITELDVVEALQDALRQQDQELDDYYTRRELQRMTGWGRNKMYEVLHDLQHEGRLDMRKKMIDTLSGGRHPVPAYKIFSNGHKPEGE